MDDRRFDQLSRALGTAASRRSAVAAGAALLLGGTARDAVAKGKRRKCTPKCPAGQTCTKGTCTCDNGGTVCGATCCGAGQRCQGGACIDPAPTCIPAGEPCKNRGRRCCDGRACGSGQGGENDIACYVPAGGACETTADCVWASVCEGGVCVDRQPRPRCGAFPMTGDAAANGRALQDAVRTAADGATILLDSGEYQFDPTSGVPAGGISTGLVIAGKRLTIAPCSTDAAVTLGCPAPPPTQPPVSWGCVGATSTAASLTLRGLAVEVRGTSGFGWGVIAGDGASIVLEDVAVQVAGASWAAAYSVSAGSSITVRRGVSVTSTSPGAQSVALWNVNGSYTCDAAVSFRGGFAPGNLRCMNTVPQQACGCTS